MGKKKRQNNKRDSSTSTLSGPLKRKFIAVVFLTVIGVVLGTVYWLTKPGYSTVSRPLAPATGQLIETRNVLNPGMFVGKAAQAYRVAAEIPKVLDSLFCYCYCKRNHGHKTLLTCFTNNHGAKCDVCIGEALYAYELYKAGKTLDEIVVDVDKRFYRPYRPHRI